MTHSKLREAMHTRPFRPFIIYLADGREFRVHHPDFVAVSPSGREASVFLENDEYQIIDLFLVTGIGFDGQAESVPAAEP